MLKKLKNNSPPIIPALTDRDFPAGMIKMRIISIFLLSLILTMNATNVSARILYTCFQNASSYYRVPEQVLLAIADVESGYKEYALNVSGRPYFPKNYYSAKRIIRDNEASSMDIGIMQVNSYWFKKFGYPLKKGLDSCFDIYLGAYVLAKKISEYGYNWKGIAAYHSDDYPDNLIYARKVYTALNILK